MTIHTANFIETEPCLFDKIEQGLIYLDAASTVVSVNQAAEQFLGVPRNAMVGRDFYDCCPNIINEEGALFLREQHPALVTLHTGKPLKDIVMGLFNAEKQRYIWIKMASMPKFESSKIHPYQVLITLTDITSQKMAEIKLSMATMLVNNIFGGLFVTDKDQKIISINDGVTKLTGFTQQDVFGKTACFLQSNKNNNKYSIALDKNKKPLSSWQGEIWRLHKFGGEFPSWTSINEVKDTHDEVTHYIHMFMDITHLNKAQNHLNFLAYHDPLTKLPNRLLVKDRITHSLQNAKRESLKGAVLFIDLDRFKVINDTYGHDVGDLLLKEVAKRIKNLVRKEDTVSRYAGDEFIVFMENIPDAKNPATLAQKLIDAFNSPIYINKNRLYISISIGISLFPSDGYDTDTLIKHADAAMYLAKNAGRNNFQYYSAELNTEAFEKLSMETALRQSIIKNELILYYQPQVCLKTGELIGVECLVRWNHPVMGLLNAMRFIPLAEESGFIMELGNWVLKNSCAQLRNWLDKGVIIGKMVVNISVNQLLHADFVSNIERILRANRLNSKSLELEITGSSLMNCSQQIISVLDRLFAAGINVTVDNFGVGNFSLSNLHRIPITKLKIDSSLVVDALVKSSDEDIARSVIALGHSLHLQVIALGIESDAQKYLLLDLGCDEGQGYLYSPPALPEASVFKNISLQN